MNPLRVGELLDNCPDMLFIFDDQQRFVACSKACLPLMSKSDRDGFTGADLSKIFVDAGSDWIERARAQNARVYENRSAACYEDELNHNGMVMNARINIHPYIDETDSCVGTIMVVNDITELVRIRLDAESSARAESGFLSNMSHEIRTPINAIKGLSELLALTKLNGSQSTYVQNIITSTNSLLSIVNDILDFVKIDTENTGLIVGDYSLGGLIGEISNVMSARATEKGLELYMDISPDLPTALRGDDVRVKQIMISLLGNAIKYTHEGHVVFRLYAEEVSGDELELVCMVEDTGVGVKQEDIPRLFSPFSRADIDSNRNIPGIGLGLAISRRLADSMGGQITVKSVHGSGSAFTVRLPQGIADASPLAAVENAAQKHVLLLTEANIYQRAADMLNALNVKCEGSEEKELGALERAGYTHCIFDDKLPMDTVRHLRSRMPDCVFVVIKDMRYAMEQSEHYDAVLFTPLMVTDIVKVLAREPRRIDEDDEGKDIDTFALSNTSVLIVDDNEVNLLVAGEILKSYKACVTFAEDGYEALELCAVNQFDMIFMDHMMPGMDGIETTIAIRTGNSPNKSVPIVALTANIAAEMRERYFKCGMNDFIGKPIELSNLSRILRQWLPAEKIVATKSAIEANRRAAGREQAENRMERIIASLDAFGMYVSDVMREIGSDYPLYISRMQRVRRELSPLVLKMRKQVSEKRWDDFAVDIGDMAEMVHDVGARDCSGRARKLCRAAREHNSDYILGDFFSLMDNMYMLQKKMEVAVPLVMGEMDADVPFGDKVHCCGLLKDMRAPLEEGAIETVEALFESLASYSLDHDLDMILMNLHAKLMQRDFAGALEVHEKALDHCVRSIESGDAPG